jgi:predicted Holliday junction resolvase-like endonuclease
MSLISDFQEMRKIYGFCPCCDEPFRLSDAELFLRGRPPRTVFDDLQLNWDKVERQIERFESQEQAIRERARELGRIAAQRRIQKIAPFLRLQKIEPGDVKVLFDPVEYVVFRRLRNRECNAIDFVDHPPETKLGERRIKSIDNTLRGGRVEWHTFRVTDDGRVVSE